MTGTITFETIRIFHDFFVVIEYTVGKKLKTTIQCKAEETTAILQVGRTLLSLVIM